MLVLAMDKHGLWFVVLQRCNKNQRHKRGTYRAGQSQRHSWKRVKRGQGSFQGNIRTLNPAGHLAAIGLPKRTQPFITSIADSVLELQATKMLCRLLYEGLHWLHPQHSPAPAMIASKFAGSGSGGSGNSGPTYLIRGCAGRGGSTAKSVPLMARIERRDAASRVRGPGGHVTFSSRLRGASLSGPFP